MDSLFLLGATASGKHEAAVLVAEQLGAEILSVDSVKVYRGMDIGSAKPSHATLARVPHHLIDLCDPSETYSAGRFVADAERGEAEVRGRRRLPFFVGGTALYYKTFVYGLFRGPAADPELRRELEDRGGESLHEELRKFDPETAKRLHSNDLKRLVRAVEVHRKTGMPISELQKQFGAPSRKGITLWIRRDREDLRRRTVQRTRRMFEEGLVDEVRLLLSRPWSREARNSVGYREVVEMLEGKRTREEAEAEVNRRTDKFIRRQLTWFRSFREATPVEVRSGEGAEETAAKILREVESRR